MAPLHGSQHKNGSTNETKRTANQVILDSLSALQPVPFSPILPMRPDLGLSDITPASAEEAADVLLQVPYLTLSFLFFIVMLYGLAWLGFSCFRQEE